jgi:hypothetical protein
MWTHPFVRLFAATTAALSFASWSVRAQEIEPHAYSPAPVGLNFLMLTLTRSSGGVAVDPTLPIGNVDATINSANVSYQRTFALLGRTASAGVVLPYAWGEVSGDVFEERQSVTRSGLADARLRLAVNLFGGPAVGRQEFAAQTRSTQIGASVVIVAPTGEYDSSKLINLGSNRWAVKPEVGWYQPLGPWTFELAAGVWVFGDNPDFYGNVRREQDPVTSIQTHLGYTFRPRLWLAADWTYYRGGATRVDGVHKRDLQESSRTGLVLSVPVSPLYQFKFAWSDGVTTRIGGDFTTFSVAVQRAW